MKAYLLSPVTKEMSGNRWKKKVERNWYCQVDGCKKIRNGSSEYCINHQAKKKYEKSDPWTKKLIMELLKGLRKPKATSEGEKRWGKSIYKHF